MYANIHMFNAKQPGRSHGHEGWGRSRCRGFKSFCEVRNWMGVSTDSLAFKGTRILLQAITIKIVFVWIKWFYGSQIFELFLLAAQWMNNFYHEGDFLSRNNNESIHSSTFRTHVSPVSEDTSRSHWLFCFGMGFNFTIVFSFVAFLLLLCCVRCFTISNVLNVSLSEIALVIKCYAFKFDSFHFQVVYIRETARQ